MTLPASGPISLQDVNIELRVSPTSPLSMNHPDLRKIAGKAFETPNSRISMADLLGRSHFTYEIYNQPMFTQRFGDWRYCMGFKIVTTAPEGTILNRVAAYNDQGEIIFDHYLRVGGSNNWMVTTNPQIGFPNFGEGYDSKCIQNPTNVIYVGVRLTTVYNNHRYSMHRLVVWDTNGGSYELYNHRNLVVTGTFNVQGVNNIDAFWNNVNNNVTLVPPNN